MAKGRLDGSERYPYLWKDEHVVHDSRFQEILSHADLDILVHLS